MALFLCGNRVKCYCTFDGFLFIKKKVQAKAKASLGGSSRVSWQCSLANLRACPVMRVAAIGGVRPTTSLTFLFDKL